MKIFPLACTVALLLGCSTRPEGLTPQAFPAVLEPSGAAERPHAQTCSPIDPEIPAEAKRVATLDSLRSGGSDALAAALIGSEANKNARLRQALAAYERCRRIHRLKDPVDVTAGQDVKRLY